jgi:hypothetical protein
MPASDARDWTAIRGWAEEIAHGLVSLSTTAVAARQP